MGIPLVTCALCEGKWLAQSITRLFSTPEGFGVCKECEEELLEEDFFQRVWNHDVGEYEEQEREQPDSFSYTSHRRRGVSWNGYYKRIFTINMTCCVPGCDGLTELIELTRPIRSNVRAPEGRTSAPELTQTKEGVAYEETYIGCKSNWLRNGKPVECTAERIYPEEGDDLDDMMDDGLFCEEEGHVCSYCLREYGNLYGANRDDTIRAYKAWRAGTGSLADYKRLAHYRRQLRHTKKAQFERTTAILDEFVGSDGGKSCARLSPSGWIGCGLSKGHEMVPISIPHGEFIGDGYLCQSCLDGD